MKSVLLLFSMSNIFVKILPTLEKQKLATDIICGKNVL